jgi:hypothetical protein
LNGTVVVEWWKYSNRCCELLYDVEEKVKIVYEEVSKKCRLILKKLKLHRKKELKFSSYNPKSIITEDHKLKGIECLKMGLVEGKAGERAKPVRLKDLSLVNCDYLISAIGQSIRYRIYKI